jgi:hypothetical protein
MSEPNATNPWPDEIKVALEDRAYSLNYVEGVQCRFRPLPDEGETHAIEIFLETTHMGHPFDLTWITRYTNDPATGIDFEISAPENEGGLVWKAYHTTVLALRQDAQAIPVFIRGFFTGRALGLRAAEAAKPA